MSRFEQKVGGEVNNILDFGACFGNSILFLAQNFPMISFFGTDGSGNFLTIEQERFTSPGEFSIFEGRMLPYLEGQVDLASATCIFSPHSRKLVFSTHSGSVPYT